MKSAISLSEKISDFAEKLTRILVVPVTLGFTLIVLIGVITRFILKVSFVNSMEYSRICFVWFCFLGSSLAYKRGEHIQFVFVMNKVPNKVRNIMKIIIDVLCLTFFVILLIQSIRLTQKVSMTLFPASGLSYSVMYIALPISAVLLIIHGLNFLLHDINSMVSKEVVA